MLVHPCPLVPHFPSRHIMALSPTNPETTKFQNDIFTVFLLAFGICDSICFQVSQNVNFNRAGKVKILLHYLQAGRGGIDTAFVVLLALCASQPSLGIAAAKIILQYAHQGLETATRHMHKQVVILESSFSVKNQFLGKSGLVWTSNFIVFF